MKISKRTLELAVIGLMGASLAGVAIAQDAAANITARKADMRTIQANMLIVNDKTGKRDLAGAKEAAGKLNAAFKDLATRFPPGSGSSAGAGTTRAKDDIFANPAAFKAKVDHAIDLTDKVVTAVNGTSPEAAQLAIGEVNALCADCHGTFRSGG